MNRYCSAHEYGHDRYAQTRDEVRCGSLRDKCRAGDGKRRQGARRVPEAARERRGAGSSAGGAYRGRQDLHCRRRILAVGYVAVLRTPDQARQGLSRSLGLGGAPHGRSGRPARDRAVAARQALCRSGMEVEPVLRFPDAALPAHDQICAGACARRRRARSADPPQGRVLRPAAHQRDIALQLRADQSGSAARDGGEQRRKSRARAEDAGRGHRRRQGHAEDPSVQSGQSRRRREHGDDAGQGDLPERDDAADPVCAGDGERAAHAAPDHPALDQQVLHPRSQAGEILHQVVRRSGHHRVRDLMGQSRQAARCQELGRLHEGRPAHGDGRDREGHRRDEGAHRRLLRRRHHARDHAGLAREKRRQRVASATFFAAQVDFTHAGDLLVFVDEEQIASLEQDMKAAGVLEGSKMAMAFNMLRSNDLIWSYVVSNYLKGQQPSAFDLLHWNSDATRMTASNHSYYLRNCYLENRLSTGTLVLDNTLLDLSKVMVPIYNLATREDHIAPAESVLYGSQFFGGPVKYVLSGPGHIAGVVNPPASNKYQYWTNDNAKSPNVA